MRYCWRFTQQEYSRGSWRVERRREEEARRPQRSRRVCPRAAHEQGAATFWRPRFCSDVDCCSLEALITHQLAEPFRAVTKSSLPTPPLSTAIPSGPEVHSRRSIDDHGRHQPQRTNLRSLDGLVLPRPNRPHDDLLPRAAKRR